MKAVTVNGRQSWRYTLTEIKTLEAAAMIYGSAALVDPGGSVLAERAKDFVTYRLDERGNYTHHPPESTD